MSAVFIIVTNAWMQHPVAYSVLPNGSFEITSFWGLLMNPWELIQYSHNMSGAVITGAFVMCSVGAFYLLENRFTEHARISVRVGVIAGAIACVIQIFPTGDMHGRYLAKHQPASIAAWRAYSAHKRALPWCLWGNRTKPRRASTTRS